MASYDLGSPLSKMQVINERWQEIQVSMDREKNYRVQTIEEQMCSLEDKIAHNKSSNQQRVQVLAEKVEKAKQGV
jgi:hypothetical protein